jgi:hypothetical protein
MKTDSFVCSGGSPPSTDSLVPSVQIPHVGFSFEISRDKFQFVEPRPDARIRAFAGLSPARAGV